MLGLAFRSTGRSKMERRRRHSPIEYRPRLKKLEDRIDPSPLASTGALGGLAPAFALTFNTTDGSYQVDMAGWRPGGTLSAAENLEVMAYNFSAITLPSSVTVSAFGTHPLGLLGTGDILIEADFNFAGQAASPGEEGYGIVGGGGGGAFVLATNGGSIHFTGDINFAGGAPGERGDGWLPGPSSGGLGGAGGPAGVGGGNGGHGGASVAGGAGGVGGDAALDGGGGGGGGGGSVNGLGAAGGLGSGAGENGRAGLDAGGFGSSGMGGSGGSDSGGRGGPGGAQPNEAGGAGGNAVANTGGGGGGGGGGADCTTPCSPNGGAGGSGDPGGSNGGTGGSGGAPGARLPGSGGGGAFVLAASDGVWFAGQARLGTGEAVVYGRFLEHGGIPTHGLTVRAYSRWSDMPSEEFYLDAGAGGGGGGGDGQELIPADRNSPYTPLASMSDVPDMPEWATEKLGSAPYASSLDAFEEPVPVQVLSTVSARHSLLQRNATEAKRLTVWDTDFANAVDLAGEFWMVS